MLAEDVFEEVAHAQWVFVVPKMLRPYFLHHREHLGGLARAAWETVLELMAASVDDEIHRPGMVAVVQTAGDVGPGFDVGGRHMGATFRIVALQHHHRCH